MKFWEIDEKVNKQLNYTGLEKPITNAFTAQIVVAPNAFMGTAINLTIYTDPENTTFTSSSLKPPISERWYVYKIKSIGTPAMDGVLKFRVDTIGQNIIFGPLSATLPSLEHVEELMSDYLTLEPTMVGEPYFVTGTPNGSAQITEYIQIYVRRVPLIYTGKVYL